MSFRPFGLQLGLSSRPSPALAQPPDGDVEPVMALAEPSLDRALAPLSADERADYRAWGPKEKFLFIALYQWVGVATAKGLHRVDGTPFDGFLTRGINLAFEALSVMAPYLKDSALLASGADQASTVLQDTVGKAQPQGESVVQKYRLLRDRAAWELAVAGATIEYEILGDDPANPGVIYTRKIGEDKAPDLSAVFSGNTPREMWKNGLVLEDKAEAAGVTFKKLDLSGANRRLGVGAPPILAILITAVIAILSFFWLWSHVQESKKLTQAALDFINADDKLSGADKAALAQKLRNANSFFDEMFGSQFPWTTLIAGAAVIGAAYFLLPVLIEAFSRKPAYLARGAGA